MLGSSRCPMADRQEAFAGMNRFHAIEVIADGAEAGIRSLARLKPRRMLGNRGGEITGYHRGQNSEQVELGTYVYDEVMKLFQDLQAAADVLRSS